MRINLTLNEARRYAVGATLIVVPVEPQPIINGEYFEWINDELQVLVACR